MDMRGAWEILGFRHHSCGVGFPDAGKDENPWIFSEFFFRFQRVQVFLGKDVILGVYIGGSEVH